ncbi:sulfotransferase family 2 domain-containing protein [Echinimonas agarilytica]|uniref:Sulfotransferase family protein n=1 Tax=Echinimonas agarilytica TaxID=1215918 RepID=A0AA41W9A2_9GAMM|nr:sulfotransferase family 2 domain-containing protein [Echinimonas agarilytica]MCM2681485.1 sulfotransferase family protein [Echinimonas agarilytica]
MLNHGDLFPYRRYMTQHSCIFVHVPKAAGTSVLTALSKPGQQIRRDHCTAIDFLRADRKAFEASYKFAFVRHPVSRLYSAFQYLLTGGNGTTDAQIAKTLNDQYPTFELFVIQYLTPQMLHSHLLLRPQFAFLCDENLNIMVDYIGKFERLSGDFEVIQKRLKLSQGVPHVNKGKADKSKETISPEVIQRIQTLYQLDFEIFDYAMEG